MYDAVKLVVMLVSIMAAMILILSTEMHERQDGYYVLSRAQIKLPDDDNIAEITENAYVIVQVVVNESRDVNIRGNLYTQAEVTILSVQKGAVNVGDRMTVNGIGGAFRDGYYPGTLPLVCGNMYELFLIENDDHYDICEIFQGTLIIVQGYSFQQAAEDLN